MPAHRRGPALVGAPRRVVVGTLVAGLALGSLTALQASGAATAADDPAEQALDALRSDATGPLEVTREDGAPVAVTSTDGDAVLGTSARTPAGAAAEVVAAYGEAFGVDGETSTVVTTQVLPSVTGGTVVRGQQELDGVPVYGGQVVTVLDRSRDVVSVDAATTRAEVRFVAPRLPQQRAADVARAATASDRGVDVASLAATVRGLRVLDPTVLGLDGPPVVRQVWEVEVRDGGAVRQTVLVGADRGDVALQYDAAPRAASRWVCDARNEATSDDPGGQVPVCDDPALREGDDPSTFAVAPDVDARGAFEALAATSAVYADLGGVDLTRVIGHGSGSTKVLVATTDYCPPTQDCAAEPFANAFWDGRSVALGDGFGRADDVVAHELTHGFVERTSGLFYLQQSGAINESMADVIGEVVDHARGSDDDSAYRIGEDVATGFSARSMKDPESQGMPATTSSRHWLVEDGDADDQGGVHTNLGVGNRAAYLISRAIDPAPTMAKTGTLYLAVIPRLTSGAQYTDLGRLLVSTCRELVGTRSFTATDCAAVERAVADTGMATPPTRVTGTTVQRASLGEAEVCPSGTVVRTVATDSDVTVAGEQVVTDDFRWTTSRTGPFTYEREDGSTATATLPMWEYAGTAGAAAPAYARTGTRSLFGYDPVPDGGSGRPWTEPAVSTATSQPLTVPTSTRGSFFHFSHAFALDRETSSTGETQYRDGATVDVLEQQGSTWVPVRLPASAWSNGPQQQVVGRGAGSGFTGFGGDSLGWGSSRLDLTTLAGRQVRLQLRIEADPTGAYLGWWLDDLRLYACDEAATPTPTPAPVQSQTPAPVPAPAPAPQVVGTTTSVSAPARVKRGKRFAVSAVVASGSGARVGGQPVTLQRLVKGTRAWRTVAGGTTDGAGAVSWAVTQRKATSYRVVTGATSRATGSTSPARSVRMR